MHVKLLQAMTDPEDKREHIRVLQAVAGPWLECLRKSLGTSMREAQVEPRLAEV